MADARDGVSGAGVPAGGKRAKAEASVGYETHQNTFRRASVPELSNQNMMGGHLYDKEP